MITDDARRRLAEFVRTATEIFTQFGYRRTKMADVTKAMGLSEGAIYRYFEGKEALFDLVIRAAAEPDRELEVESIPVPNPAAGSTLRYLRHAIADRARFESLSHAMARPAGRERIRQELESIVREMYRTTYRFRHGLAVVQRCAMDWPELAALWTEDALNIFELRITEYLKDRVRRGWLRPVPDTRATARLILELVAWFAHHQHCCRGLPPFPPELAEATVIDNIVNAYVPAGG